MGNKKIYTAAVVIVVLLASFFLMNDSENTPGTEIVVDVKRGEFVVEVNTTGELEARNSTEIMGPKGLRNFRIYNVNIQNIIPEGTYVKKGQYVASLDPSELTTKIKDAQLKVDQEESQYIQTQLDTALQMRQARDELINLEYAVEEKKLVLEQSQFEPPATIKQAEIALDKAIRAYEQAKENYEIKEQQNIAKMREVSANRRKAHLELNGLMELREQFVINAPEDGMLIYRKDWDGKSIKEGSQISAWDPVVATLPDLSEMNSITYVNEVDIRRVKVGQRVEIGLDAFPEKELKGEVIRVANVGEQHPNSDAKVFQVTIAIDRTDKTLRPGMTTSNKIITKSLKDVVYVPLESLHNFQDSITYVYKSAGLSYQRQEVKVGETNANMAQIERGLSEGDRVYLSVPNGKPGSEAAISLLPELDGKRNLKQEEPEPQSLTERPPVQKGIGQRRKLAH